MSLHFSDDDDDNNEGDSIFKSKEKTGNAEHGGGSVERQEEGFTNEEANDIYGSEMQGESAEPEPEPEPEPEMNKEEEEQKKKKKKSVGFHLKNLFNEVAEKNIAGHIIKKRKNAGEYIEDDNDGISEENEEEDELQRYIRKEREKLKQLIPEKDEFWEIYLYLNLKKKRRKIDFDLNYYSTVFKKIMDQIDKEYKGIIEEKLLTNTIFEEYLTKKPKEIQEMIKQNERILYNIERWINIPVIKQENTLSIIRKKLTSLYNRGVCCSYIREIMTYEEEEDLGSRNDNEWKTEIEKDNDKKEMQENQKFQNTKLVIEKEKLNMALQRLYNKYYDIIQKMKRHKRSELKSNFNKFMELINEVSSKLYFCIHNVFVNDDKTNITDIYKTIRRKYNIHDVLTKIQKLTQKKEVYEHYRSFLLYKYKSTHDEYTSFFKNHVMKDDVNIFNFKRFYNTQFNKENASLFKESIFGNEANEEEEEEDEEEVKEHEKNQSVNETFKDDLYQENDFLNIGIPNIPKEIPKEEPKVNATTGVTNNVTTEEAPPEESSLERAKRLARERKQKFLESVKKKT